MQKRLYRKTSDKMLSGVCSGIAEYFGIDPTLVRVIYAAASVFMAGFPGLILYILMAIIIPDEEQVRAEYEQYRNSGQNTQPPPYWQQPPQPPQE